MNAKERKRMRNRKEWEWEWQLSSDSTKINLMIQAKMLFTVADIRTEKKYEPTLWFMYKMLNKIT